MILDKKNLKSVIENIPNKPGVYRFYDKYKNLLYIGKAKNLKKRVSNYFQNSKNHSQRIWLMVSLINYIEYNTVNTEEESLILEANLIQKLQPKYNILLKDDKSFVYIRITINEEIPGIFLVRKRFDPKSIYFGPYTKKTELLNIIRIIRRIFPFCQKRNFQKTNCEYVAIKQCEGICTKQESKEKYLQKIYQIISIFEGKTEVVKSFLEKKLKQAVEKQNFELASLYRDKLLLLDQTLFSQKTILKTPENLDIINLLINKPETNGLILASIYWQQIRFGRIINLENFILSGNYDIENQLYKEELAFDFLNQFFAKVYVKQKDITKVLTQIYYQ